MPERRAPEAPPSEARDNTFTADHPGRCVAAHFKEPERPRQAVDGLYLCRGHVVGLREALEELPAWYAELERSLLAGGVGGEKVSGSPDPRLPIVPEVGEHAKDVHGRLLGWCRVVADDRGLTLPEPGGVTEHPATCSYVRRPTTREIESARREGKPPPRPRWDPAWRDCPRCGWSAEPQTDVAVMARWLLPHVEWLAAQPFADVVVQEFDEMTRRITPLVNPGNRRRFDVGPCAVLHPGCPGTLTAVLTNTADLLPSAVTCSHDPAHTVGADQWLAMGRRLRAEEKREAS